MNYELIFRSRYGQFAAWALLAFSVLFLGMVWYSDGLGQMLAALPFPLGLVYFTWWIWSFPAVVVDRRGITIRNQLRTWKISWDSFAQAKAQWGLYLYASEEKHLAPPAAPLTERTASGELTIGAVEPISLDPEDLASKKAIYAAAVPARGGLRNATRGQDTPAVPTLDLTERNKVVLRTSPLVAARILDEEKYYVDNPAERPLSHSSKEGADLGGPAFVGLKTTFNLVQIAVFLGFAAYWVWRIF